jgi:molybdenum cofactor guanylyltransferase
MTRQLHAAQTHSAPSHSAAVLAGGQSQRFGRDKALAHWRGQPLLAHALAAFVEFGERYVVGHSGRYQQFGVPVYSDGGGGPLVGVYTALQHSSHPRLAVSACDMPLLTNAYWSFLLDFPGDVVIPQNKHGQVEPLAALYSQNCLPIIAKAIATGQFKLSTWHSNTTLNVHIIEWQTITPRFGENIFFNANTAVELAMLGE